MSAALLGIPWSTIIAGGCAFTLVAFVGLVLRAILQGKLVPRSAVDDIRADRDKWESAWRLSQDTMAEVDARLDANTEALRLMQQLVDALATKGTVR